jgi:suppressor of G2 allele of SKP1
MSSAGLKGVEAVEQKRFADAIPLLTKALADSKSSKWYLARAEAYQKTKQLDKALQDCECAYHAALTRGNARDHMIDAQYRRAVLLHQLGRYADSACCARWSMLLSEGRPAGENDGVADRVDDDGDYAVTAAEARADTGGQWAVGSRDKDAVATAVAGGTTGFGPKWNRAYIWRCQTLGVMEKLPKGDPGRKVGVTKVPRKPDEAIIKEEVEMDGTDADVDPKAVSMAKGEVGDVPDEKLKLRTDYYQTSQTVTVSLFVKDTNKETLNVQIEKNRVILYPIPRENAPHLLPNDRRAASTLMLAGEIDPAGSRYVVTPRKVELVLKKAVPGTKWGTWGEEDVGKVESSPPDMSETTGFPVEAAGRPTGEEQAVTGEPAPVAPVAPVFRSSQPPPANPEIPPASRPFEVKPVRPPSYPSSSKSGPKNWDKYGADEGDDDEKNDVNFFFKQLYKDATPEQQRAMMKSFIESNGTALSTDWNDVKDRTVETIPPDGVEAKKW